MSIRTLAIPLQVSLILFAFRVSLHAQDSPSDLVVGELTSARAPWTPDSLPEPIIHPDELLEPNYGGDACDALPAPQGIQSKQARYVPTSSNRAVKISDRVRMTGSPSRRHAQRSWAKPRATQRTSHLTALTKYFPSRKDHPKTTF